MGSSTVVTDPVSAALERIGFETLTSRDDPELRNALFRLAEEAAELDGLDAAILGGEAARRLANLGEPHAEELVSAAVAHGRKAAAAAGRRESGSTPAPRASAAAEIFDRVTPELLENLLASKAMPVTAVATMLPSWNAACRDEGGGVGLARGWHIIVAGQPGAGKSNFALNLAANALVAGERVCFISLEMSQAQLVTRLLATATGTNIRRFEHGIDFDPSVARQAAGELTATFARSGGALYVNRRPVASLEGVVRAIHAHYKRHECRVFVTDYVQLCWARSADTLFDQVQQISHTLRGLAADLGFVSIALSQFNRETSANRASSPTPQGLMGGSVLENDADQVLLLDHSAFKRTWMTATGKVLLAKNRHGQQLEIPCMWDFRTLQVREDVVEDADTAARAAMRAGA
jgi:KaiC/GvpD/RAD55 family RecA-like ATPase